MKRNLSFTFAVILTLTLMSSLINWNVGAQVSPAPQQKDKPVVGEQADREREAAPRRAQDANGSRKIDRKKKPAPADKAVENDGDLPGFMNGKVNRKEYLRKRAEQIGMLRGREDARQRNDQPRIKAIQEIERQESSLRKAAAAGLVQPLISNTSWTPIGPAPLPNGQTDTVVTPVSGRVTCVAIHPTNIDIVYVGTAQSGVYRTLNGGQTWTAILDTAQTLAIGAITIDPVTPTTIFVGTGEGNLSLDSFEGVGVYRILTADTTPVVQGPFQTRTGSAFTDAFLGTAINKIIIDPTNNNNMLVGNTLAGSGLNGEGTCCGGTNPASAFIGLYFSTNAQAATPTWIRVGNLPGNGVAGITDMAIDPTNANVLVLNQQDFNNTALSGVYRSTNALSGATGTYTRVINYAGTLNNAKIASYKEGAANAVFYLASEEGANEGAVRRSIDGGATWTAVGALGGTGFCSPQCFYDIAVDVDKNTTTAVTDDIVYIGGAATFILQKSTNGAATFATSQRGLHADTHAIEIAPSNVNVVYTGNDGGMYRSYNKAVDWNSLNNTGLNSVQFQSLALHPTDRYFTIGGTQDNGTEFLQPDGNTQLPYNSWRRADFGDGGFAQIDQSGGASTSVVTMYHTYFNQTNAIVGFARVSNTACATEGQWAFKGFGAPPGFVNACGDVEGPNGITGTDNVLFYAPLELGPGTPNSVYYGTDRLYRSGDRGDTMVLASQAPLVPLAGNPTIGQPISAIGVSPLNDNVRLVGLANGALFFSTTGLPVLTSLDPTGAVGGNIIPDKYVGRVRFAPNDVNTAYIALNGFTGAQNHVYRVTNLSTTPGITNISGTGATGIPDVPVNAFAVDPLNPNNLYAGTDIGVYVSLNGGTTWAPYGTGLPRVAVFDMEIQNNHRILRVATHGKGMYEIGLVPGATLTISGTIRDASSNPISSAVVRLNNSAGTQVTTTAAGTYTFSGLAVGSNNTVTVTKAATRFTPVYRTFNDMSTSQTADFTGIAEPGGTPPSAGAALITEFRSEGPAGATDEFVELYNNTDSPVTVQSSDGSVGWAIHVLNVSGTGTIEIAIIPNGTVIPARGHLLLVGSAYSLRTLTVSDFNYHGDIPNNTGVALFSSTQLIDATTRLDAIGFTGVAGAFPDIFREGTPLTGVNTVGLQHSYVRRTLANGNPRDTNDNSADVAFVSTTAALTSVLGAPGPENVFSPITRTNRYSVGFVDPSQCSTCQPNYERVGSDFGVNKAFGTLTLRRKFTNNTGQAATRLRFRVIDITTLNNTGGGADLRLVDSTDTTRAAFFINGTQIELPMQPLGGGMNSSATVVLPDGGLPSTSGGTCPAGATCSLNVQFTLGVQVQGTFRFIVNIESLP